VIVEDIDKRTVLAPLRPFCARLWVKNTRRRREQRSRTAFPFPYGTSLPLPPPLPFLFSGLPSENQSREMRVEIVVGVIKVQTCWYSLQRPPLFFPFSIVRGRTERETRDPFLFLLVHPFLFSPPPEPGHDRENYRVV